MKFLPFGYKFCQWEEYESKERKPNFQFWMFIALELKHKPEMEEKLNHNSCPHISIEGDAQWEMSIKVNNYYKYLINN